MAELNNVGITDSLPPAKPAIPTLETHGLCLDYEGVRYINSISLKLVSENLTVVMGPNGAGKSLLLRLLHGLILPTKGEIRWNGLLMGNEIRQRQAMVFQRPVLLRRSVAANIHFVLRKNNASDECDEILDNVGLLDLASQPARSLSVGEQQRLAVARALATKPEILFLDEPTASLDPGSVLAIEQIVSKVHTNGTRVIFVTHDIGQARRLADDVVFLHQGKVTEHTSANSFFKTPSSNIAKAYSEGKILI